MTTHARVEPHAAAFPPAYLDELLAAHEVRETVDQTIETVRALGMPIRLDVLRHQAALQEVEPDRAELTAQPGLVDVSHDGVPFSGALGLVRLPGSSQSWLSEWPDAAGSSGAVCFALASSAMSANSG